MIQDVLNSNVGKQKATIVKQQGQDSLMHEAARKAMQLLTVGSN